MGRETLRIQNATVPRSDTPVSIRIEDGKITGIGEEDAGAETVVDAEGGLVTPAFVDCHTHLDKAMLQEAIGGGTGTLQEAITVMREQKEQYTLSGVQERAEEAIRLHLEHGCTTIRTHIDIDRICGMTALEGVVAARDSYEEVADIEIVAFPQEGLLTEDGSEDLIREALENGADVIGGAPALEESAEQGRQHINILLDMAEQYDVPIDMHIDETMDAGSRTLEDLAVQAQQRGLDDGRVTASHACALSAYPEEYAEKVIDRVAAANMNVVTNPATNLLLQGRDAPHPKPRGITRVGQLRDAGVTVAAGQDNMQDGFNPYGQANMVKLAWLLSHATHLDSSSGQEAVLSMVAQDASAVVGAGEYGLFTGAEADLNVFSPEVRSVAAALREAPRPRHTIHDGTVLDTLLGETGQG